jgi:hypothetical protein
MFDRLRPSQMPSNLVEVIRHVRRRWRLKLALRGAALVLALACLMLVLASWGLESVRFSPRSIVLFRVLVSGGFAALVVYFFIRPLLRRVTDEQVALYIEEHEPSLEAAIVSAVEATQKTTHSTASTALVQRLVESAIEKCLALDAGRRIERDLLKRHAAAITAVAAGAVLLFLLGPAYFRHAVSALLFVSRSVEAASPYRIAVKPGHATVPKGADQSVTARLTGFDTQDANLMVRRAGAGTFEMLPLVRAENGQFDGMLFDLAAQTEYFVEAAGVRSAVFTLRVVDLPYVRRLELEYHFPAYTGLASQKVEDGGDIAVLKGTEVRVRVVPTLSSPGGRVALGDKQSVPLTKGPDGTLTTSFVADYDGFYRVELDAPTGERVVASPQYTIDVISDQAPTVAFTRPGRDTTASPIEEVFVEAHAEDDYGVRGLDLVYSVNGGREKIVKLFDGRRRLGDVTAGHTFYLEELGVQPGDSVSYYARAADNDTIQTTKRATSDLYFLRVRPFRKDFREATSQTGGGGGGGGGNEVDALSEQQRRIIAATFNVQRDRRTFTSERLRENTVVVALSQARLREQVEGLVTRLNSRLVEPDPSFKKIAELLPQAVGEMKAAEAKLQAISPDGALPPEQRALQFLQKAEEEYELQVSVTRNAAAGSGGGSQLADELADLFELELDRMANQYETADRAAQQANDQQLDALLEKLKELARRQEQEAERQRRRAAAGQASAGGGDSQRALAEQAEEAARRLEKLSRDENRPELMDSARRLREAADAMRRAAANGDPGAGAQASAALQRLQQAQRQLQGTQSARAERDINDALRQAEDLAREQRAIAEGVRSLSSADERRTEQANKLADRKDALESKLGSLEKQLDSSAADARQNEKDASRKLSEAAGSIRDSRVRDKIKYSKAMITRGAPADSTQAMESDISNNLEKLRNKLGEAAGALGRPRPDATAEAVEKARRLARGMEALEQRMKEAAEGSKGSKGSEGSEGSKGSESSKGAKSSPGSEGSRGGRNDGVATEGGQRGDGDTVGRFSNGYGWGDRRPGRFSGEDIRQFRGEIRQWSNEVRQLRGLLRQGNLDPNELDAILRALREMDDDRVYQDVTELQRLQTLVTDGLKRFEYGLRRRAEGVSNDVVLSGSEEVPEEFRKLVEQYYRSLSKTPPK